MTATATRTRAHAGQVGFGPQPPRRVDVARIHVGLDLGTHLGYAAIDDNGRRVESGVWNFEPTDRERKADPGARWTRVANTLGRWFAHLREASRFQAVGYEIVHRHEGVLAAHVYGGMEAMLLAQLSRHGLDRELVEVADIKFIATGRGNAKKDAVMVAARVRWPHLNIDAKAADNEADALWCAEMVRRRTLGVVL